MTNSANTTRHRVTAATLTLAATLTALTTTLATPTASAENTVGLATNTTTGTNNLTITLTQGNPDSNGDAPTGKTDGVTIHLHRLTGIDPTNPTDKAKVEAATLDQIKDWPTDLHITATTNDAGVASFTDLPNGIYLVTSTAPNNTYREINTFLVAVPFTTTIDTTTINGTIIAKTHKPNNPPTTPGTPPTTPDMQGTPPTTPDTPGTPPTKPGTPPTTPPTPDTPGGSTSSNSNTGNLAITGTQALTLAAAATLIGIGLIIITTTRRTNNKNSNTESEER